MISSVLRGTREEGREERGNGRRESVYGKEKGERGERRVRQIVEKRGPDIPKGQAVLNPKGRTLEGEGERERMGGG